MNERVSSIAASVIKKSGPEDPADAVLRKALKEAKGISREDGRSISGMVFAYYRWLGWLDRALPTEAQIRRAMELSQAYRKKPSSFSDAEMDKAIPEWVRGEVVVAMEALLDGHAGAGDGIGGLGWSAQGLGFSDGALLAELGPAANLARLFIVFSLAQLLL